MPTQTDIDALTSAVGESAMKIAEAIKTETAEIQTFIQTHTGNLDTAKLEQAIKNLNGIAGDVTNIFTPEPEAPGTPVEPAPETPVEPEAPVEGFQQGGEAPEEGNEESVTDESPIEPEADPLNA